MNGRSWLQVHRLNRHDEVAAQVREFAGGSAFGCDDNTLRGNSCKRMITDCY
jgi:hypothetical protein